MKSAFTSKFIMQIVSPILSPFNKLIIFSSNYISSLLPKSNIVILRLSGVIGNVGIKNGLSFDNLRKNIDEAFNYTKVKAVFLIINSPGGSPVQSELIASRIMELSKEKNIPVYSFIEDVGASGGYWLALAGEKIFASKSSIIGSIGVVSKTFGLTEIIKKLGIERRVYTEGKNKSTLDPFLPAKPEEINIIKNLQKNIYEHFVAFVKQRRKNKIIQNNEELFTGCVWSGETAHKLGLIDGIDTMHDYIKKNFDSKKVKIKYIEKKESWFKKLLGISHITENTTNRVINTIEEKIEFDKFRF